MDFYLIIPVSSIEISGEFEFMKYITTGASIYHIYRNIYQASSKTWYNVYRPNYSPNRYPWPRKKLTRKTLDKCFSLSMFYKSVNADNIDELVMELNMHSEIYKVVI